MRVRRVVCAVDWGTVVNPDTVRAQIQSGIIFGITAALHGKITLKDGRVRASQLRHLPNAAHGRGARHRGPHRSESEPPGGMGEAGTSCIPAAVTNAIFAATGKRLRQLPIDAAALKQPA